MANLQNGLLFPKQECRVGQPARRIGPFVTEMKAVGIESICIHMLHQWVPGTDR